MRITQAQGVPVRAELRSIHGRSGAALEFSTALKKIQATGNPGWIPHIVDYLLADDPAIVLETARIVASLFQKIPVHRYLQFDIYMRDGEFRNGHAGWGALSAKKLADVNRFDAESYPIILALATFHWSGFVREQAIQLLTKTQPQLALPLILLRASDWVDPVATTAKNSAIHLIETLPPLALIAALPVVTLLHNRTRKSNLELLEFIEEKLRQPGMYDRLISGLRAPDLRVRRAMVPYILNHPDLKFSSAFELLMRDPDPHNRLLAARAVATHMNPGNARRIRDLTIRDSYAAIRMIGLDLCMKQFPEQAPELLENLLFDDNRNIRASARFYLSKNQKRDFAAGYRSALAGAGERRNAVAGLGETGHKDDATLLLPFVASESTRLANAALVAIDKLAGQEFVGLFLEQLANPRPGIARQSAYLLRRYTRSCGRQLLWEKYLSVPTVRMKHRILHLGYGLPKWDAVLFLLRAWREPVPGIQRPVDKLIRAWLVGFNSSFIAPRAEQIAELAELLPAYAPQYHDTWYAPLNHKQELEYILESLGG